MAGSAPRSGRARSAPGLRSLRAVTRAQPTALRHACRRRSPSRRAPRRACVRADGPPRRRAIPATPAAPTSRGDAHRRHESACEHSLRPLSLLHRLFAHRDPPTAATATRSDPYGTRRRARRRSREETPPVTAPRAPARATALEYPLGLTESPGASARSRLRGPAHRSAEDSRPEAARTPWKRTRPAHAACGRVAIVAVDRIGTEGAVVR